MIRLYDTGVYLVNGDTICVDAVEAAQKAGIGCRDAVMGVDVELGQGADVNLVFL